jgi:hypothetical protein
MQFEKDLQRCSKLMEELDSVITKKKDASQQASWRATMHQYAVFIGARHANGQASICVHANYS